MFGITTATVHRQSHNSSHLLSCSCVVVVEISQFHNNSGWTQEMKLQEGCKYPFSLQFKASIHISRAMPKDVYHQLTTPILTSRKCCRRNFYLHFDSIPMLLRLLDLMCADEWVDGLEMARSIVLDTLICFIITYS